MDDQSAVEIDYTNWRGERSRRKILPINIFFGSNQWHPEEQWLLVAIDLEKNETRTFSLSTIHSWKPGVIPIDSHSPL